MEIKSILSQALNSPSGDNCQPWRFEIEESRLFLYNDPKADESLYNYGQFASYISEGALIENIKICASSKGYSVNVSLFPKTDIPDLVAEINFLEDPVKIDSLYKQISRRSTNRKPYFNKPVSENDLNDIKNSVDNSGDLTFVSGSEEIRNLAHAASQNERLVLGNFFLHRFLFSHIRWSKQEVDANPVGFYVETFEMNVIQKFIFKLASNWTRVVILNKLGLNKKIELENEKIYRQSAVFGFIHMSNPSKQDYIKTGMILQRVWLKATELGLYLHPLTGIIFLHKRISESTTSDIGKAEESIIYQAYEEILNVLKLHTDKTLTFMFRMGYAEPPTATSPKLNVNSLIR